MPNRIDSMVHAVLGTLPEVTSSVVVSNSKAIYTFYIAINNSDLYYVKSTDQGRTWSEPVAVRAGNIEAVSVWYDRWTPGDSGDIIHMAYTDSGTDDVFYRGLNTSTDSFVAAEVVAAANATHGTTGNKLSITKAIGGNLYIAADVDGGTEQNFVRSTDSGGTWAARTTFHEGSATDHFHLVPGFAADTQDIICIFWDGSALEISRKVYDDSANTWAETSIATSMTEISLINAASQFAVSVDDTNNKILLSAWTNRDLANADLRFWSIDESSITEGTNIVLNSGDDQQMTALTLNGADNSIIAYYGGKSDGSETAGTSIGIYCKVSKDGGTTWGPETLISNTNRSYRYLSSPLVVNGTGEWFTVCYETGRLWCSATTLQPHATYQLGI